MKFKKKIYKKILQAMEYYDATREMILRDDADLEARKVELENFLSVIKDNYNLYDYLCDFGVAFYRDGDHIPQKDLSSEEKHGQEELQYIMMTRMMSGEQKVNGERREWSNGFLGSRWYDAKTMTTYCRASFISKKTDDDSIPKKYRIVFRFENRQKKRCGNPECENQGLGYEKCGICKSVYYCSKECQHSHWKIHKKICKKDDDII
jgi:hypothetical protein